MRASAALYEGYHSVIAHPQGSLRSPWSTIRRPSEANDQRSEWRNQDER
jgi:hypothetical protein